MGPSEYDCERCGIRVWWAVPPPPESIYCLECRFIEGLEGEAKRQVEEFLDRIRSEGRG